MPKKHKVYSFEELSDEAKERALEELHDINVDYDWWDYLYQEFVELCELIGVEIISRTRKIGKTEHREYDIWFEDFRVSFEARVDIVKHIRAMRRRAWKKEFPTVSLGQCYDAVSPTFMIMLRQYGDAYFCVKSTSASSVSVVVDWGEFEYIWVEFPHIEPMKDFLQEEMKMLEVYFERQVERLREYMSERLRADYEYMQSDDAIIETIEANEYKFTEDGEQI